MFWGWYVRQYSTSLKTIKPITFLRHTLTCVHSFLWKDGLMHGDCETKEKEDKHILYSNRHKVSSVTRTDILIQYTFQGLALVWCNFLHYYNNNWWLHIWLSAQHMSIWRLQFNSGNGSRFKILKLPRECYSSFFKHRHLEFISCQKL